MNFLKITLCFYTYMEEKKKPLGGGGLGSGCAEGIEKKPVTSQGCSVKENVFLS